MKIKRLMECLAVAGAVASGAFVASPAAAAFTATLDPVSVTVAAGTPQSFTFDLLVSGLDETGVDLADAPGLSAVIGVSAGSPFRISLYDDPGTAGDSSTDSLGTVFADVLDASVAAGPLAGPDTHKELSFVYLAFDPNTFDTLSLRSSGSLVRFVLEIPAGVSPGSWEVRASVSIEGDLGTITAPDAVAATTLVPEPGTYALFLTGLGLLGFGVVRSRNR